MTFLIDGYNLLNCAGITSEAGAPYSLEASRVAIAKFLRDALTDVELERTTVVFDGREAPPGLPRRVQLLGVDVRFSKRGEEADDLLETLIRANHAPRQLTVVSSDHRVQRAARRRRARAVDSEVWYNEIRAAHRSKTEAAAEKPALPLSASELTRWTEEFQNAPDSSTLAEAPPEEPESQPDPRIESEEPVFPDEYLKSVQEAVDRQQPPPNKKRRR